MSIDLFLIGGQSNAAGSAGNAAGSPDVALFNSVMWQPSAGALLPTDDPVGSVGTGSAWPAFANRWFEETGRRCILVQSASSGSGQTAASAIAEGHHWDDGGNRYPDAVALLDDAIKYLSRRKVNYVIRGILWHQGERDCQATEGGKITASEYRSAFENMVSKFRTKYGSGFDLWLFRVGKRNSGDTAGFQGIRAEQYDATVDSAHIHMVYTDCVNFPDRALMLDELHYIQAGYDHMGSRGASAIALETRAAAWTPDSVLAGVANSFWRASLPNGNLFRDAELTEIADEALDPVGGVSNHSRIGTATLSQSTPANKFNVSTDGRIERDATTNTQHLLFSGLSIDFANGFCVAADFDTDNYNAVMFGASSLTFYIRRIGDDLVLRVGEEVNRTVLGVFSASGPHRRRVIVSGDSVDFTVFVDGVDSGTISTGVTSTSYPSSALGVRVPGEGIVQKGKWGSFLVAEKDLRANAAEIDSWLEASE